MCGIAGFYGFRDDNLIKKFSDQLSHRGPNGEGYFINNNVSLLSRRLAIIDRKGGIQPIYNEDKSLVVVYNGEIYNFRDLRKQLLDLNHKFKTKSDTEVIIHAYEQWEKKCFDMFNGMFAIALYDIKKKKLILARDHFGIKPLYFSLIKASSEILSRLNSLNFRTNINLKSFKQQNTNLLPQDQLKQKVSKNFDSASLKVIFSSEIKPIIESGLVPKKPNDRIIYRYLKHRVHDDKRETFFEGIYRVMPGEMVEIRNPSTEFIPSNVEGLRTSLKLEIRKYTNLKNDLLSLGHPTGVQAQNLTKSNIKEFKDELIEAIKLRLISEVPVGTCLSGGIDSSVIVSIINNLLKEKVKEAESVGKIQNTFSAIFPGATNDEEEYIDKVKSQIPNLKSHKIYPEPEEFFREIEEFVKIQEEPVISTGPYAQYKVIEEAQKHVTVLLDGQGTDEMLAGYLPYYFVYLQQLFKEKKFFIFFTELFKSNDVIRHVLVDQFLDIFGIKKIINPSKLLNTNFSNEFDSERLDATYDNLKKRLIEDIFSNSLPALLRYEDKNAMKFSIEGRVPFLDFNLLRYLFSLPDEAIINNGWNKNILREAVKGLVTDKVRHRRNKIGFTTPEHQWFMRMKNKIYSIFLSESFATRRYFNQKEVLKAFQEFIEGKNDDTMLFWRLLNVEIWLRVFFDPPSLKASEGQAKINKFFGPNEGKKLEIRVGGNEYLRYPIRTDVVKKGDNLNNKIVKWLYGYMVKKNHSTIQPFNHSRWFLVVSEKIVAIAQGRSYFIWDIKPGFWPKTLSKFVKKTPYGIGLGSPWTMQLAITELGLPRILLASFVAILTKPLGLHGLFYKIAGPEAAAIDGPTEYSLYPSNVSAKLGPKAPQKVAEKIHEFLNSNLQETRNKQISNLKSQISKQAFLGVVIIDANDLGQKVLGNSTGLDDKLIEKIFSDNPMGQADEQTPIVLVIEKK